MNSEGASCTLCDSHYTHLVWHRSVENKNTNLVSLCLSGVVKVGTENMQRGDFLDACISF